MIEALLASTKSTPAVTSSRPFVCLACRLQSSLTTTPRSSREKQSQRNSSQSHTRKGPQHCGKPRPTTTRLRSPGAPHDTRDNCISPPSTPRRRLSGLANDSSPTEARRNATTGPTKGWPLHLYDISVRWTKTPWAAKELDRQIGNAVRSRRGITEYCNRHYHTSSIRNQQLNAVRTDESTPTPLFSGFQSIKPKRSEGIRTQLRQWQELNANQEPLIDNGFSDANDHGGTLNGLSRLPGERSLRQLGEDDESQPSAEESFIRSQADDIESESESQFLQMGDLVEVDYWGSERESTVAIFVRRIGAIAQLYDHHGRWIHIKEKFIQWSIPNWIPPGQVKPLLDYLPDEHDLSDFGKLMDEAYIKDLSVPRTVAGPLVIKLVKFYTETKEVYRKNASALDNAHEILAHETNLRYGSLPSLAGKLLGKPVDKLSLTALFAVRQALTQADFAFDFDRRSHRLTGHLQIRSKEQARVVYHVRDWVREWQESLAIMAAMTKTERQRFIPSRGAAHMYGFIAKAKKIVLNSRKDRVPTPFGNVGPSKSVYAIEPNSESVRISTVPQFTQQESLIVRFIETWACTTLYDTKPRILSLPPLILQAMDLYEEYGFRNQTGGLFLQELGAILPYQNRLVFDQHLLLPSSEHSKPLHNLMTKLEAMRHKHDLRDSMKDLRHDWGALPVYCIDQASALEIDDGISIEETDTESEYWVHVHIANPTAYFSPDHPLARMARHMGESLYMPDKNYMMLPRWVGEDHLSLAKDRPCLTFSAKMDDQGRTLENKITPGIVRNVKRLTTDEVNEILDFSATDSDELVLTVGGHPPPPQARVSGLKQITSAETHGFEVLERLATKRTEIRSAAGGLFYTNNQPEAKVWQSWSREGLAQDDPYHLGSRTVAGDPVIQFRTRPLQNNFSAKTEPGEMIVREMMLLACEVAATWCAERQIPAIFRGSVAKPDTADPDTYFREVVSPAVAESPTGEIPMHLGKQYLSCFGSTHLATEPFVHRILGMENYAKATSPLRRYGDMILHWQIEAALRKEAETGKSLVTSSPEADRRFLPFSPVALKSIMRSLQPREKVITRAKNNSMRFWTLMLMFRAFHFGEGTSSHPPPPIALNDEMQVNGPSSNIALYEDPSMKRFECHPSSPLPRRLNLYFIADPDRDVVNGKIGPIGVLVEFNLTANMVLPKNDPLYSGSETTIKQGDTWEVELLYINVWYSRMLTRPIRLINRVT